jgi:hypothetical protein
MDKANELHIIGGNIAISNSPVQGPVRGQSLDRNVLAVLKTDQFSGFIATCGTNIPINIVLSNFPHT